VAAFFDPSTGGQTTIMERLMFYMSILVIFLTNSHHLFFVNIYESFKVIPILKLAEFRGLQGQLGYLASNIFLTAMDLSITVLVIIFLLDFSLGLLARLAPQVNVFSLGFQIKPVLGLWIFVLVMPILVQEFDSIVQKMTIETYKLFEGVKVR